MSSASIPPTSRVAVASPAIAFVVGVALLVSLAPPGVRGDTPPDHLVVSEVVTGGASASDELIEIHNPTLAALPLEGLELVYVTASGATRVASCRMVARCAGGRARPACPRRQRGGHLRGHRRRDVCVGHGRDRGIGGAAHRRRERRRSTRSAGERRRARGRKARRRAVAPSGASIERLPGGALGSTRDTNDNASDFVVRDVPDPQNLGAPPTPDPLATRHADSDRNVGPDRHSGADRGADADRNHRPHRGADAGRPRVDRDRASAARWHARDHRGRRRHRLGLRRWRWLRGGRDRRHRGARRWRLVRPRRTAAPRRRRSTTASRSARCGWPPRTWIVLGTGPDPAPATVGTGAVAEAVEGRLVRVEGTIAGAPTVLTSGTAYDLDDGSGPVRVLVGPIDRDRASPRGRRAPPSPWSGWSANGTRAAPAWPATACSHATRPTSCAVTPGAEPTATPSAGVGTPGPSATLEPVGVVSIAAARELPKNSRRAGARHGDDADRHRRRRHRRHPGRDRRHRPPTGRRRGIPRSLDGRSRSTARARRRAAWRPCG